MNWTVVLAPPMYSTCSFPPESGTVTLLARLSPIGKLTVEETGVEPATRFGATVM